ncbi:hypothetical protein DFJ74DRAFT_607911, partial [Hyaloraphidium curvatum]
VALYWLLNVCTLGLLFLATHWFPSLRLKLTATRSTFREATHVFIADNWGGETIEKIERVPFGGPAADIWPGLPPDEPLPILTMFVHRTHRFILRDYAGAMLSEMDFETTEGWRDPEWTSVPRAASGLGPKLLALRSIVFGANSVAPPEPSILAILFNEVLNPFYIFQIFSIILWLYDSYQLFATAIAVISAVGILGTLFETRSTMRRIRELSSWDAECWAFRGGAWLRVRTGELLPGDVVEGAGRVHPHDTGVLPADCVLLTGEAVVTESMLTGESIPVTKTAVPDDDLAGLDLLNGEPTTDQAMQRWFLFAGTKVVRVKAPAVPIFTTAERLPQPPHSGLLALVVRTGFSTTKGALTRSILYPKPGRFRFYEDSIKFIVGMTAVAVVGFAASVYNFVRLGASLSLMIRRALDLVTVVVPPALPATMGIGAQLALARLRRYRIFCTSPPRINVAGKLDAWVFDKTGTLTGDSLEVLGVRGVVRSAGTVEGFTELYREEPPTAYSTDSRDGTTVTLLLEAMATCHGIKVVSVPSQTSPGTLSSVPVGDPMDLQMFGWTGFEIEEGGSVYSPRGGGNRPPSKDDPGMGDLVPMVVRPPGQGRLDWSGIAAGEDEAKEVVIDMDGSPGGAGKPVRPTELGVVRTLEFSSALRRMTVVVRRVEAEVHEDGTSSVKASPNLECFVKGAPEVLLDICNEESVPANYTELLREYTHHGYRVIAVAWKCLPQLPFHRMLRMDRASIECDLRFLGFIVFENKMKPTTPSVIQALKDAKMRQMMCTGDNLLTAISVSKECGIVNPNATVFVPRFIKGAGDDWARQSAAGSDDGESADGERSVRRLAPRAFVRSPTDGPVAITDYAIAITGDVFEWMMAFAPREVAYRMLAKARIYARFSPDQKQALVERLQAMHYSVGFCGDGANDVGALKSADVGVSLSEAEASVAAPFTSRSMDLDCVLRVVKEGRAALVTSFSAFKYMALYSVIQFVTVTLLYSFKANLGDFQYLYIDLVIILPVAIFMGWTEAADSIHPKNPTSNLFSKKVLASLGGQALLMAAFQIAAFVWVRAQPWYDGGDEDDDDSLILCYEDTVLFLLTNYQYLLGAMVFSIGRPFRKGMHTNVPFILTTALLLAVNTLMLLGSRTPQLAPFLDFMQLLPMPWEARLQLLAMVVANIALAMLSERYVWPWVAKASGYLRRMCSGANEGASGAKIWKGIEREMRIS